MGETMDFPDSPINFIESYSFIDRKEIYTNGSELVPLFRVKQMLDHYYHDKELGKNGEK